MGKGLWTLSLRSLPFPLLVLVLVLLGGNRHAWRGQSRLLVCQTEEDVGVTAGMHHLRSLHRRRSVSTSILVLIPFPFPFLLLVVILILDLLDQRPLPDHDQAICHGTRTPRTCRGLQRTSEHLADGAVLEDGLLHRVRVRTSTSIVVIRAGGGGGSVGGIQVGVFERRGDGI